MSPENAKIFQADDHLDSFNLKRDLEKSGYQVVIQVRSSREALEQINLAKKLGVTVAILDNRMPKDGDGETVARALREAIQGIKIISLCAQSYKPPWADYHFNKGEFSYQTATQTLPDLIRNL